MRHYPLSLMLSLIAGAALAAPSKPQVATTSSAIVAVVNDEVITGYDLNARTNFVLVTTKIPGTPDAVARLRPQILRALVDEKLQVQEARRNNVELSPKELEQAIASIEKQREMPPGTIGQMLAQNRIPEETFTGQIKAQMLWGKLLQKKVRSRVKLTDEEISQMARKLSTPVIKQELKIALLQLPVDKPARDKEVRAAAEKMVFSVRGGADFEELARQFAGGAAREGGQLPSFWVQPDDLDPAIAKALTGAKPGFVSDPLRNTLGYTIIKVYDTRDLPNQQPLGTEITFKEIAINLRSSADKQEADKLLPIAEDISKNPGTCEDKGLGKTANSDLASVEVKKTTQMLSDLPAALRVVADGMKVGDVSTPLASDEGIMVYMLCGKREGVTATVDTERARSAAYQQRMELEAQKYMRNLRRDSFVEVRG